MLSYFLYITSKSAERELPVVSFWHSCTNQRMIRVEAEISKTKVSD